MSTKQLTSYSNQWLDQFHCLNQVSFSAYVSPRQFCNKQCHCLIFSVVPNKDYCKQMSKPGLCLVCAEQRLNTTDRAKNSSKYSAFSLTSPWSLCPTLPRSSHVVAPPVHRTCTLCSGSSEGSKHMT